MLCLIFFEIVCSSAQQMSCITLEPQWVFSVLLGEFIQYTESSLDLWTFHTQLYGKINAR